MHTLQSMSRKPNIIMRAKTRNHRQKLLPARKMKIFVEPSEIQKGREKYFNGAEQSGEM
jgi:hypothetical protein